ncbi:WD40 repeat-containing protein [Cavenderia fasciculata]|uniref:WD40 repeat-containing protein n=1 Tax=Cavenderia fasciculata TaxID=261658 RepID=F4QB49_CACFS|nr:WD40 repeat-containing protein [Cavenderia fasciculata]EGG14821.1 WD40 repeat-containing protein [Cavenderia fasciculata]|eukprot:XP_004351337.1 WD40 repeat-containing protein [Cavenderia fasciculata]
MGLEYVNNPTRVHYLTQKVNKIRCFNKPLLNDINIFATGTNQNRNRVSLWGMEGLHQQQQEEEPVELAYFLIPQSSSGESSFVTDLKWVNSVAVSSENNESTSKLMASTSDGTLYMFQVTNLPSKYGDMMVDNGSSGIGSNTGGKGRDTFLSNLQCEIEPAARWEKIHKGSLNAFDLNLMGDAVASVGSDGAMHLFSLETRDLIYSNKHVDGLTLNSIKFMTNNEVITSGANAVLKFWDLRIKSDNGPIKTIKQQGQQQQMGIDNSYNIPNKVSSIHSIAVHHDQSHIIATGNSEGQVTLYDFRNSYAIDQNNNHQSYVWEVQFSKARSNQLYSCSEDGFVYLYDYNRENTMMTTNIFDLYNKAVTPFITTTTHSSIDSFDINPCTQTMFCTTSTQSLLLKSLS